MFDNETMDTISNPRFLAFRNEAGGWAADIYTGADLGGEMFHSRFDGYLEKRTITIKDKDLDRLFQRVDSMLIDIEVAETNDCPMPDFAGMLLEGKL